MLHFLWPKNKFFCSEKGFHLFGAIQHFVRIRLVYPKIKKLLDQELDNVADGTPAKVHLVNLQLLCEYFIPTVSAQRLRVSCGHQHALVRVLSV